ncbi:MAG: hypothetical protein KDD11_12335 [Acidobacteria bacterium]|nr:hypothetical protein [Acidobacteriota bacterium]
MSNEKPTFGNVGSAAVQVGPDHPINAVVGQPFWAFIPNEKNDPGASWFNGYDPTFLTLMRCGYQPNYDGTSSTWAEFVAKKTGTTVIEGVLQPHLINPLYMQYNFTVTIT